MAILDNPMFEHEEERKSVSTADGNEANDAENQGMVAEMGKDPVKSFGMEFAKKWPFGTFKTINTFLLLALFICAGMSYDYSTKMEWSHFRDAIPIRIFNNRGAWMSTDIMAQSFLGLFIVSFLSMTAYWILRRKLDANKHSLGCIGIWDIVFSSIAIPIFLNAFVIYGLLAAAEWKWYFPKLTNSSTTLAELTETKINSDDFTVRRWDYEREYYPFPRSTTPSAQIPIPYWKMREMESRKNTIIIRLAMDSSILILLAILIPMNLFSFIRIRKMIKRTNLWLSLNEYSQFYTESNENEKKYAQFWPNGLFKFLFWFIPIVYCIFADARRGYNYTTVNVFPFALSMFFHWLYFIRKTRFRSVDDLKASKLAEKDDNFRFSFMVLFDIFVAFDAILFYIFFIRFNAIQYALLLHLIHLIYIVISFGAELFKGKCPKINFKLPQISISVNINVVKGNENEAKTIDGDGQNGKKMEENAQQEEEKKLLHQI